MFGLNQRYLNVIQGAGSSSINAAWTRMLKKRSGWTWEDQEDTETKGISYGANPEIIWNNIEPPRIAKVISKWLRVLTIVIAWPKEQWVLILVFIVQHFMFCKSR